MPVQPQHLRIAGELLVAAVYSFSGAKVAWPLQPTHYDLLVDDPSASWLMRVQVKTCTRKARGGAWECWITRSQYASAPGGKRRVAYSEDEIDVLAVVDGDLQVCLIPFALVAAQSTVTPRAYDAYRVAGVSLASGMPAP